MHEDEETAMVAVSPSGAPSYIIDEMKHSITPEAFNNSPIQEVLDYRADGKAAVLVAVLVVDMGTASIFTDFACSSQTMSLTEARRLLDEHRHLNKR